MKKTIIPFLFVFISSGLLYVIFTSQTFSPNTEKHHYKMKMLFEKALSNPDYSDYCRFYENKVISLNRTLNPFGPTPTTYYGTPYLLYIDNSENIYLSANNRIEIYNSKGELILIFNHPNDALIIDFYSWRENHFYMFPKKNNSPDGFHAFDMNLETRETVKLEQTDLDTLSQDLLPDSKNPYDKLRINQFHLISNSQGFHYGLAWGFADRGIYYDDDDRFVDPKKIGVILYDSTHNYDIEEPTYLELLGNTQTRSNVSDTVNIEKLFKDKIIFMGRGNSFVDKNGNIYLCGIKSNDAQRIFIKSHENFDEYDVKVSNPVFFMAKLERK